VELPPQRDVDTSEISANKLLCGVRDISETEEHAMDATRKQKQSDKKRRKYHMKKASHSNEGLVKCDELSCRVSVRSHPTPSGNQKLRWVFKLYNMESARSLDDHEVPTLMKNVCDMLSSQINKSKTPPTHKRFKVRLNIMEQQSRSQTVTSRQTRFILRDVRKSTAILCGESHGDGCTSCATYGTSDEQSTQVSDRRYAYMGHMVEDCEDDKFVKHVKVRHRRHREQAHSSELDVEQTVPLETVSRPLPKSSKKTDSEEQRDCPLQLIEKKTSSSRQHRRRSSLPSDPTANPSAHKMASKKTDQPGPVSVKLRHQRRGGSKRHSYHGAGTFQNFRHKHSESEHGNVFDNVETVSRQEVVPSGNGTSAVVHHHHHEHHHHHYHVYHHL
jgi:hypothetical protein